MIVGSEASWTQTIGGARFKVWSCAGKYLNQTAVKYWFLRMIFVLVAVLGFVVLTSEDCRVSGGSPANLCENI